VVYYKTPLASLRVSFQSMLAYKWAPPLYPDIKNKRIPAFIARHDYDTWYCSADANSKRHTNKRMALSTALVTCHRFSQQVDVCPGLAILVRYNWLSWSGKRQCYHSAPWYRNCSAPVVRKVIAKCSPAAAPGTLIWWQMRKSFKFLFYSLILFTI
jgi:hypothetical protein